jgi:phosphoglycerate dehydrogenase-like enzyme
MAEIGAAVDVVTVRRPRKGATDLGRLLERTQPTVFLAAWSSPSLPAKLPASLRYVCYVCGSVRTLVSRDHLANGLVVTNWGASISRTVAEAALMHVLACLRRATEWTMRMHARRGWNHDAVASASLFERRVGLHGFGRVARQLVALLRPFQVKVMVFAPDADERAARRWRFRRAGSLGELFAENDVVIELAPLNRETTGVVTERHLRSLPRGGVFVNVGRGEIVDERALVRVAREGRIQFGLDVFATEPLAANHPLRGLLNVSLTPHVAGPTQDRRVDAGDFAIANLRRFAAGQRLRARITPDIYDMST